MLDTNTLYVALIAVLLAGLIAHVANSRIHHQSVALRWWGWGMMAQVLGVVAIVAHQAMPFYLAVLAGTAGLVGGQFMIIKGMAVFSGQTVSRAYYLTVSLLVLAGVSYWTLVDNSAQARFSVISLALIAGGALLLNQLAIASRRIGMASVAVLFGVVVVSILSLAWTSGVLLVSPPAAEVTAAASEQSVQASLLITIAVASLAIFGFVLLTSGEAKAELERLAMTDQLTGLPNRRGFEADFDRRCKRLPRGQQRLALALLDIDHFKQINDTFGHEAGDEVLERIAKKLSAALREGDFLARMGGEEFVLLFQVDDAVHARTIVERIRGAARESLDTGEAERATITLSAGLAVADKALADATDLYRRADTALYQAKRTGRDRLCVAEESEAQAAMAAA